MVSLYLLLQASAVSDSAIHSRAQQHKYISENLRFFQVIDDKSLNFAVHDRLDVAHFIARTVILDQRIGTEDIGTDLRAPLDLFGLALERRLFLHSLFELFFKQAASEVLERHFLVLKLGTLVLTGNHDARREVRNADCGLRLVDLLSACARGTVHVDADIFCL